MSASVSTAPANVALQLTGAPNIAVSAYHDLLIAWRNAHICADRPELSWGRDFSGEWTLNVKACALSPVVAPVVQGGFVRIEHREPAVSVHLCIIMNDQPVDVRFERPSNWDGEALVFVDTVPTPNGDLTIAFRYELDGLGHRLRASEELRGAGREQDNVWVFERAAAP